MRVLITGANGHLGRRLIQALPADWAIEAVVRSERARAGLLKNSTSQQSLNVTVINPSEYSELHPLAERCEAAVHLIGRIKESRDNLYADSHEIPARAMVDAAAQSAIRQIIYISILGADRRSDCACLRARAAVEDLFTESVASATLIRVPMVLGEMDRASFALAKRAGAKRSWVFRAESLEQPIYAGDLIAGIVHALQHPNPDNQLHELAGPESLTRRQLIKRAARVLHNRPSIISLPMAIGFAFARFLERTQAQPPITRDMLRILDHDDDIDPSAAAAALNIRLTALDDMLSRVIYRSPYAG